VYCRGNEPINSIGAHCPMCRKFTFNVFTLPPIPLCTVLDHVQKARNALANDKSSPIPQLKELYPVFMQAHGVNRLVTERTSLDSLAYFARCWIDYREDFIRLLRAQTLLIEAQKVVRDIVSQLDPGGTYSMSQSSAQEG
jgi:hypothetical protein